MSLPHSVAEVIQEHVTLELECIDRMYLNVYVPALQHERGGLLLPLPSRGDFRLLGPHGPDQQGLYRPNR